MEGASGDARDSTCAVGNFPDAEVGSWSDDVLAVIASCRLYFLN